MQWNKSLDSLKTANSYQPRIQTFQIGHALQPRSEDWGYCLKPPCQPTQQCITYAETKDEEEDRSRYMMMRLAWLGSIWQRVFVKGRPHLTDPCVACSCHSQPLPSSVFLQQPRRVRHCAHFSAHFSACTICTLCTR